MCSVHVCVLGAAYFIFVHAPDSDNSTSQLPAGTVCASHEEEDPPASHRRCGSFAPIWPVDEQMQISHHLRTESPTQLENLYGLDLW